MEVLSLNTAAAVPAVLTPPWDLLLQRPGIKLRVLPELWPLADEVARSGLHFSLIRMTAQQLKPVS